MLLPRTPVILTLAGLVACAPDPAMRDRFIVSPGARSIEGAYTVETPIPWTRLHPESRLEKMEVWSSQKPEDLAEQIVFVTGLVPGEPLAPGWEPRYGAGMTPEAVAQFVVNSHVLHGGFTNAAVHRVWPARFGSVDGFRFEFGYTTGVNIDVHGIGAGAVKNGRLYLIYFSAAGKALYDELRPIAEQIMDSATL